MEYNLFAYRLFLECCYWPAQHDIELCYWPAHDQHDIVAPGWGRGGWSKNLDKLSAKRFFSPDKCFLHAFLFEDKKFPTLIPLHPH